MQREKVRLFLQEVALFEGLSAAEYDELASVCRERTFAKGHTILYGDDPGTTLFVIAKGSVKIVVVADDGREHILGILGDKDFFGEMSLLDGEPRSASAVARDASTVLSISREDFQGVLRRNTDISLKILTTICQRLRHTDRHLEALAFLSAPGRVARVLLDLGRNQGEKTAKGTVIRTGMTRQELASIAGTTRETLTRVLMEFQEDGLVDIDRDTLTVRKEDGLRARVV
ncbi:MAG: Crp/Fnr family transcriptional regulator [Candidatus Sericytochromatia bacterium]|nr:Crp/Fnr family transcriptional regulator [Candidatus Sericytochromatia bacterium]